MRCCTTPGRRATAQAVLIEHRFAAEANSPLAPWRRSWQAQARKHGGWVAPFAYAPDTLTNNELGWKTMWMDRRIQWNGAIYQEDWNHAQISVGDANGVISFGIIVNGGNYRVRGIETSVVARVTTGLTIEAGAAWNHSELVKQATFLWADGTPIDFSALQTSSGQKASESGRDARQLARRGAPLSGQHPRAL